MTLISRSAIVTRKQCETKRYRTYEFRGTGIVPKDFTRKADDDVNLASLPKVRGAIFHSISLAIVEGAEKSDWVDLLAHEALVLPDAIRAQQTTLIRRAMLGWDLIRGPWWRTHFDVISAEKEWIWQLTPTIGQPLRLDKILRRKDDGFLGIFDYKTMGAIDPNWIQRHEISAQTHLYVQALKERSNEFVLGICYDGVLIGKMKNGSQNSPFVQGYRTDGGKISPKWQYGREVVDLTQYDDDKWLDWIHHKAKMLEDLYVTSGFVNPPSAQLLHTKAATGRAEEEWAERIESVEVIRATYGEDSPEYATALSTLEKNDEQCLKYGVDYACPFVEQCWHGLPFDATFEPRKNHHEEGQD